MPEVIPISDITAAAGVLFGRFMLACMQAITVTTDDKLSAPTPEAAEVECDAIGYLLPSCRIERALTASILELVDHGEEASRPLPHNGGPCKGPAGEPHLHEAGHEEQSPPAVILHRVQSALWQ